MIHEEILKLQQACLTPLKEDLADWLNKVLCSSQITADNFMDKLENGVVLCRLAKIISSWCEEQLKQNNRNLTQKLLKSSSQVLVGSHQQNHSHSYSDAASKHHYYNARHNSYAAATTTATTTTDLLASPLFNNRKPNTNASNNNSNKNIASVDNYIACNNATANYSETSNQSSQLNLFMTNLIRMSQIKIWDDAKCRTFFARDNVCNFIKWSKQFGVNQSVLFESDDLVLHGKLICLVHYTANVFVQIVVQR